MAIVIEFENKTNMIDTTQRFTKIVFATATIEYPIPTSGMQVSAVRTTVLETSYLWEKVATVPESRDSYVSGLAFYQN